MKKRTKKCLSAIMAALIIAAVPMTAGAAHPFTDVKTGSWYFEAVEFAYTDKLFGGTSPTSFSPDLSMKRSMFVQVLANKTSNYKKEDYKGAPFNDTPAIEWYTPAIQWASENEIVGGVGNNKFNPNGDVTREQMAFILYNYAGKTKNDTEYTSTVFDRYPDKSKVSSWAQVAMKWATSKDIIKGINGKLDPQGTATRAQVAQVFKNAKDVLVNDEVVAQPAGKFFDAYDPTKLTYEEMHVLFPKKNVSKTKDKVSVTFTTSRKAETSEIASIQAFITKVPKKNLSDYLLKSLSEVVKTDNVDLSAYKYVELVYSVPSLPEAAFAVKIEDSEFAGLYVLGNEIQDLN